MNLWLILLVVLIIVAVSGGHWGGSSPGTGFYPASYGYGLGGVILVVLVVLFLMGRL